MPYFVDSELNFVNTPKSVEVIPENIDLYLDTEYDQDEKLVVESVGILAPELSNDCAVFLKDEINEYFHPVFTLLESLGLEVDIKDCEFFEEMRQDLSDLFKPIAESIPPRKLKKSFYKAINDGLFDNFLNKYELEKSSLLYVKKSGQDADITVNPRVIVINLIFFFMIADLFKIFGKNWQPDFLAQKLNQRRTIRFDIPWSIYGSINGELIEFKINLRDTYYRIPPLGNKSLEGHLKAYGIDATKLEIDTPENRELLGVKDTIKACMSKVYHYMPELGIKYLAQDVYCTQDVDKTQQTLHDTLRTDFEIPLTDIKDSTGSIVSNFITDLAKSDFGISDKDSLKLFKELVNLSRVKNLQEIELNDYGIQSFLTIGGLLFSRTARYPHVTGNLGDNDLKSCYPSYMKNQHVYLGQPVVSTLKYDTYTLKEIIEVIKKLNIPRDAWIIRVSGLLDKAVNTLIMSDLKFTPKRILCPTVSELNPSRKSIEEFNAYKTAKSNVTSVLLTKEIKFGLISPDLLDCIDLLPDFMREEYYNLRVNTVTYYHPDLMCDSLEEVIKKRSQLPENPYTEKLDSDNALKTLTSQLCQRNVSLRFDIGVHWDILITRRAELKKVKNPLQEIYKLVGNSGYGVLACLYLSTNNLIASNLITAAARSSAWVMLYGLNGMGPITDGSIFSWDNVPIGKKFKDLVSENPNYLTSFDPSIISGLTDFSQNWIDKNFKKHLQSFYDVDENHIVVNRYSFELKDETFTTSDGGQIKTVLFNDFTNNNAGNYSKGMVKETILIDGTDYDFVDQNNFVKARSFKGKDRPLIDWYLDSIKNGYKKPLIYSEFKLIKFGDGNTMAIKFLKEYDAAIAHPMGFSTTGYKAMKLVTRSQFLFQTIKQLLNFETNETKFVELSKKILTRKFWQRLTDKDLEEYGATLHPNIDYFDFAKTHPVGTGFELLALTQSRNGSIEKLRNDIQDKIESGCINFNAALNIDRNLEIGNSFKYLLAAMIVLKANAELKLYKVLKESVNEPTLLIVEPENIKSLEQIMLGSSED